MTSPPAAGRIRRLLVLLPSLGLGGTEGHSLRLAASLLARGIDLRLAAEPALLQRLAPLARGSGPAPPLLPAALGWDHAAPAAANRARQQGAAAALLDRLRPDAAILPLPWPDSGGGIFAALAEARMPTLAIAHLAPPEPTEALRTAAAAHPPPDPALTLWAAVSAPVARRVESLLGLPAQAVRVVPNAVRAPALEPAVRAARRARTRAALGLAEARPLVLVVGRLDPVKGSDLLPGIADALAAAHGGVLACAGEGPLRPELAAAAAARPDGRLRLLGQAEEMTGLYLAADALLLPSRLEGHPLVFLEAAAHGVPVVATAAALEALPPERRAEAATVARAAEAGPLAEALCGLLSDPGRRRRQVAAAQALLTRYGEQDMLDLYARLLRAAYQRGAAARGTAGPALVPAAGGMGI